MNYTNLTANLLRLSVPFFYYCQSHLPYSSAEGLLCIQFACLAFQPRLATRQDRALRYLLAWRMTRISAAKIICIHNKLIKSQFPHNATHFRGQLFQLSYNRNAANFTNVLLAKSGFCYAIEIQRQSTLSLHNNPPSQRNWK